MGLTVSDTDGTGRDVSRCQFEGTAQHDIALNISDMILTALERIGR